MASAGAVDGLWVPFTLNDGSSPIRWIGCTTQLRYTPFAHGVDFRSGRLVSFQEAGWNLLGHDGLQIGNERCETRAELDRRD